MNTSKNRNLNSDTLKRKKHAVLKEAVTQLDLEQLQSVGDLVGAFQGASIQARNVGAVAQVYEQMILDDERPTIILGIAGPLIAAGLRKVIRDLVEFGFVDCLVSTGAILYQDLYQSKGFHHYKGNPDANDAELRDLLVDRIYDTYVDEEQFIALDQEIGRFADGLPPVEYSSRSFLTELSKSIADSSSILGTCHRHGVPVFSPALNDSSIGIGLTEHHHRARGEKRKSVVINSIRDNYELTQLVVQSKRTAAVYVAGGVPKNFINDSIVMAYIFGADTGGHKYAVQMTTDMPQWGGLSGSTLAEATSWGKLNREASTAMAFIEPSVSLPLVAGYLFQKGLKNRRQRLECVWDDDVLKSLSPKESKAVSV